MSRLPILTTAMLAALGAAAFGGSAIAQAPGQAPGPRYLSWNARPAPAAPADAQPTSQPDAAPAPSAPVRRPNRVIPHGGMAFAAPPAQGLTPAPGGAPGRLTPATAWLRAPAALAVPVAETAAPPPPPPVREMARVEPPPAYAPPAANASPPPPTPRTLPEFVPDRSRQPAPAAVIEPPLPAPAPTPTPAPDHDPMAPRRDAPIFRIQQPAPPPAQESSAAATREAGNEPTQLATVARNADDRPAQQGARYYSVHRQNGQQPDAMVMPEPTYVDALTLTMTETPASRDLAEPDQGPTLIRDNQGRMRAAPAASDGDHQ